MAINDYYSDSARERGRLDQWTRVESAHGALDFKLIWLFNHYIATPGHRKVGNLEI